MVKSVMHQVGNSRLLNIVMNASMKAWFGTAFELQALLHIVHCFNNTATEADLILVKHNRLSRCDCALWLFEMNNVSAC